MKPEYPKRIGKRGPKAGTSQGMKIIMRLEVGRPEQITFRDWHSAYHAGMVAGIRVKLSRRNMPGLARLAPGKCWVWRE